MYSAQTGTLSSPAFSDRLRKAEPFLFFLLILLNLWPALRCKFFLTLDGPSHLYNAVLLRELLTGDDAAISQLFVLNAQPVPNLTSHVLLALFSSIFPAWLAEKLLLLIYLVGLPYAFRAFVLRSGVKFPFAATLLLPVTYSFFFYLGFYNFLLAFLPMFMLLRLWSGRGQDISWHSGLRMFGWLALVYFSHMYVFALTLFLAGIYTLIDGFLQFRTNGLKPVLKKIGWLFLLALPFLLLLVFLLRATPIGSLDINQPFSDRVRALLEMSSLKGIPDVTTPYTTLISIMTGTLVAAAVVQRFMRVRKKQEHWLNLSDSWLVAAIVLLGLYLVVPDYVGGGMNCVRLQFMTFICAVTWTALQPLPGWIFAAGIAGVLVCQLLLVRIYSKAPSYENEIAEWVEAAAHVEKGTITLPIVFTKDPLWIHSAGYLGAAARVALYDNYEAGLRYFPVTWNAAHRIRMKGLLKTNPLTDDRNPAIVWLEKPVLYADNVAVWGTPLTPQDSSAFREIDSLLVADYIVTHRSKNLQLFKRKK